MKQEEVKLEIQDFEDKKASNGRRFTRFKTSHGWMSAFDKELIDELKKNEGKEIKVEIAIDEEKNFTNIRKILSDEKREKPSYAKSEVRDFTSMYVSYAKDIFLKFVERAETQETYEQLMSKAIGFVKQAKESFENKIHGMSNNSS